MILNSRSGYWATGIAVRYDERGEGWFGSLDFYDDATASDEIEADRARVSTEGSLHARYAVRDGENPEYVPPAGWRQLLAAQAKRLGWETYGYQPSTHCWALWNADRREWIGGTAGRLLGTLEDAIDEMSAGPADARWIREHAYVEKVSPERLDALEDWDSKSEAEKAALRPDVEGGGTRA